MFDRSRDADEAWAEILRIDGRTCMTYCCELVRRMMAGWGRDVAVERIAREWPDLPHEDASQSRWARLNLCYAAWDPEAMPTALAVRLFEDATTAVRERHVIAAGLSVSADKRRARPLVRDLLSRIGSYPAGERHHQRVLDCLRESAVAWLEA